LIYQIWMTFSLINSRRKSSS